MKLKIHQTSHCNLFNSSPISPPARPNPAHISSPLQFQPEEAEKKTKIELRVCTNRACRRQGSLESLRVLSGIAPPHVAVAAGGCLGKCGAGPNLVVLPDAVLVKHCGTPARAAETMSFLCLGPDCGGTLGMRVGSVWMHWF
ncbi:unnamed protein product [Cuscuta campestris]|uniref:Uncharacterized protein n=1 Tax=Cuscuta campestris TaxID=132261 RepID=A0A484KGA5_9ASTE|nr:unnamed protein product [Cuscuta campestris]